MVRKAAASFARPVDAPPLPDTPRSASAGDFSAVEVRGLYVTLLGSPGGDPPRAAAAAAAAPRAANRPGGDALRSAALRRRDDCAAAAALASAHAGVPTTDARARPPPWLSSGQL
jgi:hypothetical protein